MIAYLKDEPGADVVEAVLQDGTSFCYAHSVNLCEVYYLVVRESGEPGARQVIDALLADGLIERPDMGRTFWERVGSHKARGKIALADCFCLALAQKVSGQVVTSDHAEFEPLVPLGICPIVFIR
jgi:predicted nucleic acid-binding protein